MRILLLALLAAAPAAAAPDTAALFATRPAAMGVALSPDGSKIVYLSAYRNDGRAVMVAEVATGKVNVVFALTGLAVKPYPCRFKTETRLICSVYGIIGSGKVAQGFTRVLAVDTDGKNVRILGQRNAPREASVQYNGGGVIDDMPGDPAHVLMQVDVAETDTSDTNIRTAGEGRGAALVDINTGVRRIVERTNTLTASLDSDGQGNVRLRGAIDRDSSGYVRDRISYSVRPKGSRDWKPLGAATISDEARMWFEGFDDGGDNVFQIKPLDGRKALYKVAADGSGRSELVFAHPRYDVDGVLRIGKYNRAVAATYADDRDRRVYFDAKLDALDRSLSKALPGHPDVAVVDESWDGTKKLVYADTADRPGRYYLFDTTTKKLGELVAVYPGLDGVTLGTVKAVTYTAADGTKIPGYLTLPPGQDNARGLPAIVMPHGGPAARDTSGFDWLPQYFASQGYAVLQPNFRGSTGYGSDFFAKNGFQSWKLAVGDIADGARWLAAQGIADPKKLAIFGWSYGGYAALQANVVDPGLFKATIAVAPVTDLTLWRQELLEYTNYKIMDAMIGTGPHVVAGSPARNARSFAAPVLIFHGDKDQNVDIEQGRTMASALRGAGKQVEFVAFPGLDHQLDDSVARRDMLSKSAAFLAAALR